MRGWSGMSDTDTNPGDEAASGTPGTGENVCPHCRGSGEHDGIRCPVCGGSGKVTEGLAGG
jgi:DnaJ-class molecular chaperone